MRRRRQPEDGDQESGIDLTPMLDIVFIMLIFFIVTTSFVKESGIDVRRPTARTAAPMEHAGIMVGIGADGTIWIDKHPVELQAVRTQVERLHAENPQGGVVISADVQTTTGRLVRVMDMVRQAGVSDVAVAATVPDR